MQCNATKPTTDGASERKFLMFREKKMFYVVGRININWINECLIFCHNVQAKGDPQLEEEQLSAFIAAGCSFPVIYCIQ